MSRFKVGDAVYAHIGDKAYEGVVVSIRRGASWATINGQPRNLNHEVQIKNVQGRTHMMDEAELSSLGEIRKSVLG